MTTTLPPFIVHTAAAPGPDMLQRCVLCGFVLTDNTAWAEGRIAVMEGDDSGPSWWPAAALVATDKTPGSAMASCTYTLDGRGLDHDEQLCT